MEAIFFVIRLPFFLIAAVVCIVFIIVGFPLAIAFHGLWLAWIFFARLLGLPFRLIGAAWTNDKKVLTSGIEEKLEEVSTSWAKLFSDPFSSLRDLANWLEHGSGRV